MADARFQRRDLRTGEVVDVVISLPAWLDFEERRAAIKRAALALLDEPALGVEERLACNRCGHAVALAEGRTPAGWTFRPDGDYCPACASLGAP